MNLRWDSPAVPLRAGIILQHGFARSPRNLDGLTGLLTHHGFLVVRPEIPSFTIRRSLHDEGWLDRLGEEVAAQMRARTSDVKVIGVGHSAGAAVVAGWRDLLDGLVLLDPVDRHGRIGALAGDLQLAGDIQAVSRAGLAPTPVRVITADPSGCNRHGLAARTLAASGGVIEGRTWISITGSSHPDPERIPAVLTPTDVAPADLLARIACRRPGSADAVCRWGRVVLDFLAQLLATDRDGRGAIEG